MGQALATGDVLRGKYRLEHVLGRGGMGTVHLATHVVIGQRVAIKIVNFRDGGAGSRGPHVKTSEKGHVVARFLREARAASLLASEHVVRILDVDATEDGDPFMVMELLQGTDLGALLTRGGRLPLSEAVGYVLQACEALAEAHAAGIVHRDLKPSNLFRTETARGEARIKLLDFGISKLAEPGDDLSLTETNAVVGSPLFMSPEQLLSSRDVDHRTDIWSLGVTLYQLLSGALPFEASTATGLGAQIAATDPRPLADTLPEVPRELEQAVMRCLARAKQSRFDDVVALARAIAPFATDGDDAVRAVERAAERGAKARLPLSVKSEVPSTPPPEASGERWTRSQQTPAPLAEPAPDPRLTASAVGVLAPRTGLRTGPQTGPAGPPAPAPAPAELEPTEPPAVAPSSRAPGRRTLVIGVVAVLAVLLAIAFGATRLRRPTDERAKEAASATERSAAPSGETPATAEPGQPASASASAAPKPAATAPPRSRPRAGAAPAPPPGKGTSWSKDPAELELK
jgi:serine/threonine-protein kinase